MQRPPVDVGDKLTLEIETQGSDGQGIARLDGFVIFVDKASCGDTVKVIVEKCARTYATARRLE